MMLPSMKLMKNAITPITFETTISTNSNLIWRKTPNAFIVCVPTSFTSLKPPLFSQERDNSITVIDNVTPRHHTPTKSVPRPVNEQTKTATNCYNENFVPIPVEYKIVEIDNIVNEGEVENHKVKAADQS